MLDVAREDDASLFDCQIMYWRIIHSTMMKIVLDVFDVKVCIQARKKLTRRQVFIE